jgi:hypothetical protein
METNEIVDMVRKSTNQNIWFGFILGFFVGVLVTIFFELLINIL